jgi:GNAT superfamily N-acetyltransferase
MTTYDIQELVIPASVGDAAAGDFVDSLEIMAASEADAYATDELHQTAAELLPFWQDLSNPRRLFGVKLDGALVARGVYDWIVDETTTAYVRVDVLADYRRRGIGTAMLGHLESLARADGRGKLISYAASKDADGARLDSPTGFGSLPLVNADVQFLLGHGFSLEQVERGSRLPLPHDAEDLRARFAAASARAGSDYALHHWLGSTPRRWLDDVAMLHTRMSTDAPTAGLEEPEDVYTPERVADNEEKQSASRELLTAVVEHLPTGRLVGYTTLSLPLGEPRPVFQDDTLVLREHRGHRLGMLLKVANIAYLEAERPGNPSIVTWNAEENRFMLDVNEAVGFEPMGYEGAWKKLL